MRLLGLQEVPWSTGLFFKIVPCFFFGHHDAALRHIGQVGQKFRPLLFTPTRQHFGLQGYGNLTEALVKLSPGRRQPQAVSAAIVLMTVPRDPAKGFHPFDQGGNRVRIAGDQTRQAALSQTMWIVLYEGAQGRELIGRDAGVGQAPPKSLVEAEPGVAQQNGKSSALGSIDWRTVPGGG